MSQYDEQRAMIQQRPEYLVNQQLYFEGRGRNKRGPPTPNVSGLTTPQDTTPHEGATATGATAADHPLVSPIILEDHTAISTTAAGMGVDINTQGQVEHWLQQPIRNRQDVMEMISVFHRRVARPDMMGMVAQLETALKRVNDSVFACHQELNFMVSENRASQRHAAGLMLITTGWPQGLRPEARTYMLGLLGWMLAQVPEVVTYLSNRGLLASNLDHTAQEALPSAFWYNALQADPVTVPQGDMWSSMTMLNFKSWDIRAAFLRKYGGQSGTPLYTAPSTPQAGKHVRMSPCTPQWQRKLELPLRVLIACVNAHEDTQNHKIVILWKSLTLMQPVPERDFRADHTAFARLFYEEKEGTYKGRLEIVRELASILQSAPTTRESGVENLWQEKWNDLVWGSQWEYDQAEKELYRQAKASAHTASKGVLKGKGKRHWSQTLLHNSWYSPYPFVLEVVTVDAVAFIWDEFCDKCSQESEKVGTYELATYGGKPVVPTEDTEMTGPGPDPFAAEATASTTPPRLFSAPKSPSPALPGKGGGKS